MSKIKNIISYILIVGLFLNVISNAAFAFPLQQPQPSESKPYQGQQFDFETHSRQNELLFDHQIRQGVSIHLRELQHQRDRQLINDIDQIIRQINIELGLDEDDGLGVIY